MARLPDLIPDCSSCAALCCVVFAFDKSESFAIDKAAGEVCPNLDAGYRCKIFGNRRSLGFSGCVSYDCYGAGQRVSRDIFGGKSWKDDPHLKEPMGAALSILRRIHGQLSLLKSAEELPLNDRERAEIRTFVDVLNPEGEWTSDTLSAFAIDAIQKEIGIFLQSLRRHIKKETT